ncbi:MAG: BspA family leucine-rich repeat surface protein [Erysipelotrichaceae bacterium]|nr:BspA family leucine-rich repeat surface protein [Erysipelotrichaceae bacterium]
MKRIMKALLCLLAAIVLVSSVMSMNVVNAEEAQEESADTVVAETFEETEEATEAEPVAEEVQEEDEAEPVIEEVQEEAGIISAEPVADEVAYVDYYLGIGVTQGGTYDIVVTNEADFAYIEHYGMNGSMNCTLIEGDNVVLTAHSSFEYEFKGWYEGVTGSNGFVNGNNGTLISMDKIFTYEAHENRIIQGVFEYIGHAYAVLLTAGPSAGTMVFTRSYNEYENDTAGTLADRYGSTYTGVIFSNVEKTPQSYEVPWKQHLNEIKTALAADTIRPESMQNWFYGCSNLTSFSFFDFDTTETVSMIQLFGECSNLTSGALDLQNLKTDSLKKMNGMFRGCESLTSLDLSRIDTSHVEMMPQLFYNCVNLTDLNISNFDTSNVTDMSCMFKGCRSLEQLDVTHFDTSKVISIYGMFADCALLTSLDLSHFDTSNVQYMYEVFQGMASLETLDLHNFVTTSVDTYAGNDHGGFFAMFMNCRNLRSLDISGFDLTTVTMMADMFRECNSLVSIKLGPGFNKWIDDAYLPEGMWDNMTVYQVLSEKELYAKYPANASDWAGTWQKSEAYAVLDDLGNMVFVRSHETYRNDMMGIVRNIAGYDYDGRIFSNVENTGDNPPWRAHMSSIRKVFAEDPIVPKTMYDWFSGAVNLTSFWDYHFDTSECTSMFYLFDGCNSLSELYIDHFDTSKVQSMYGMFYHCRQLSNLDLSHFNTSSLRGDLDYMFRGCSNLESVDLSSFDTSRVTSMAWMFDECPNLKKIRFSGKFDTKNVMNMCSMFYGCSSLTNLDLRSFDTGKVTYMESMFDNCFALKNVKLGAKWTKWTDHAYLPEGRWENYEKSIWMWNDQLYSTYPDDPTAYEGTWVRGDALCLIPLDSLVAGESEWLRVYGDTGTVTWESSDPSIATVSDMGMLEGIKAGLVTITVSQDNGSYDSIEVRILFTDVADRGKYFYEPVYWAFDNGITTGTSGTKFSPNDNCTRGQVVTFLWRAMGCPEPAIVNPFEDISEDKFFYKAVLWAYENGITTGTSATTFSPNAKCKREQIVTFLYRTAVYANGGFGPDYIPKQMNFPDVKESNYFYDAVLWAYSTGITTGVDGNTRFGVGQNCVRGMVVTFLKRYRDAYPD